MRASLRNMFTLTDRIEKWYFSALLLVGCIWKGIVWFPTIFVCWWNRLTLLLYPPHGLASTFLVSADRCGLAWTITFAAPLTTTSTHFNNNYFSSPGKKSTFFRDRERVFRRSCNAHSSDNPQSNFTFLWQSALIHAWEITQNLLDPIL